MRIIDLQQNTEKWLKFRKDHIGSSDAPIIMNQNPWCTPYQLWRRKLDIDPEQPENEAMRRGKELEPKAREHLENDYGFNCLPIVGQSEKYPWMIASFDAYFPDLEQYVEIKCGGEKLHMQGKNGVVPPYYMAQLLHQLIVSESEKITYMSFDGESAYYIDVRLNQFTDEVISHHIQKTREFCACLDTYTQPELTDRDYIEMDDEEWKLLAKRYQLASQTIKEYESIKDSIREKLMALSQGRNCKGHGITLSKVISKGRVDYSKIPELSKVNLDHYRNAPYECWKINTNS